MRTVLVAVCLGAVAVVGCSSDGGSGTFCTAEAMLGPEGESYGRSAEHGCRFVDDDGEPLTTRPDGRPLCYDDATVVIPCE